MMARGQFNRKTQHEVAGARLNPAALPAGSGAAGDIPALYAQRKDYLSRRAFTRLDALDPRATLGVGSVQQEGYAAAAYPAKAPTHFRKKPLRGERDGPGAKRA